MERAKKERILVVGENRRTYNTLSRCLSEKYAIDSSSSFNKAMNMIMHKPYNVVIAEIGMHGAKGVEVLHKLKEIKSDIPVIVITTHNSVPLAVRAMKAGAYDYITSPFNSEELKIVVLHASEWRKMIDEVKEKRIFQEMAIMDGLTRIYNRRYFDELLHREVERATRYGAAFSLLLIDVDNLKNCNDAYGHQVGDELLRVVANSLIHKTRGTDFTARYGGDEFAIIAPHTDKKSASLLAARVAYFIANSPMTIKGSVRTQLSVSIGVATFAEDAIAEDELVKRADEALYEAKKLGKNRVCIFGVSLKKNGRGRAKKMRATHS